MTNEEKRVVLHKAINEAGKVFGCDPAYFGGRRRGRSKETIE